MHKIFELKGMDIDQLQSLASELGIKGFKKMEKDDLVYGILDEEARQNAQNVPDKPVQKKRGRPRKAEAKPEVKETDKPDETEETVKKPEQEVKQKNLKRKREAESLRNRRRKSM